MSTLSAQLFTTGSQPGGYALGSVDVFFYSIDEDTDIAVEIWSTSGTGTNAVPDAKLYDLETPASIASASSSVLSFTPATSRTLSASTTYAVVIEDTAGEAFGWHTSETSEAVAESGWSIANDRHAWATGSMSWYSQSPPFQIAVKGPADTTTDATLSNLELEDDAGGAVTLSPMFSSTATSYTATVKNRMDRITLKPTKGDDDAEVNYFDGSDMALTDAHTGKDDFQVDLDVGANTIKVEVTAEDDNTTQTYTVTVTREAAATGRTQSCVQTITTAVSG